MEKIDQLKVKNSNFYIYESSKYKNAAIKLQFSFKYEDVDLTALKTLSALLTLANREYNSIPAMASYLESLYGTSIHSEVVASGDAIVLTICANYLSEVYTEKGNTEKIIKLMSDMVYRPNFKNNLFEKSYYKMIIERIYNVQKSALERKEVYAMSQYATLFEGTQFHQLDVIDNKAILKLKQEAVLKQYELLLKAPLKVFVVGDNDKGEIVRLISENFNLDNKAIKFKYRYPVKEYKTAKVEKSKKYAQSFLIMLYDHGICVDDQDYYKVMLTNALLSNKLFKQVREKAGLCYMIYSRNLSTNGVLEVLTGIEAKNYNKAIKIINKQFDALKQSKITKKEFKMAKESVLGSINSSKDSLGYMLNNRLLDFSMFNKYVSIDEVIENIKKLEMEDVVKVSQKLKYLTHYFLKGVGGNE